MLLTKLLLWAAALGTQAAALGAHLADTPTLSRPSLAPAVGGRWAPRTTAVRFTTTSRRGSG
jgi:hypothetical protein